jgi:hypothetical protein
MINGRQISNENLNEDISFSSQNEQITKQIFIEQGFIIKQWICFQLPMSFPNVKTFLSFPRIAPWFNDEKLYSKAENETKRILHEEYGFHLSSNQSFHLQNDVIILIASK